MAIIDAAGNQVIEYGYDVWGRITRTDALMAFASTAAGLPPNKDGKGLTHLGLLRGKVMKRIEYFELLTRLFKFKTISDKEGNEFVLFSQSRHCLCENIKDKTEFEALENHVHLLDNIKKDEFERLIFVAKGLGQALLDSLTCHYPNKKFIVFVSLKSNDSMIIRFHQKWEDEEPYYASDFKSTKEKVLAFET